VIAEVIHGSVNSEVKLQLPGNRMLTAIVTVDAIKELALVKGSPCTALIKASHVLIAVDA
jgi:molybdate transport system regulatory protein